MKMYKRNPPKEIKSVLILWGYAGYNISIPYQEISNIEQQIK